MPWKLGCPPQRPSDAITSVSPILKLQCITLSSAPGGTIPGGKGSGLSRKRISISTSAPSAALVELERLLAPTVEAQIGLDLHGTLLCGLVAT